MFSENVRLPAYVAWHCLRWTLRNSGATTSLTYVAGMYIKWLTRSLCWRVWLKTHRNCLCQKLVRPWADHHVRHGHACARAYALFCKSGLHHLTKPSHMTQLFLKRIQGGSDDAPLKSGWWFQPLCKNMSSSVGIMKFPAEWKIKFMFQTTNQIYIWYINVYIVVLLTIINQ